MNLFFLQGCFGPQNKRFLRGKSDPYRERPFFEAKNSDHPKLETMILILIDFGFVKRYRSEWSVSQFLPWGLGTIRFTA